MLFLSHIFGQMSGVKYFSYFLFSTGQCFLLLPYLAVGDYRVCANPVSALIYLKENVVDQITVFLFFFN